MLIRNTTLNDLQDIVELRNLVDINNIGTENGFLSTPYNYEDFMNFFKESKDFYVIQKDNKIIGYLLSGTEQNSVKLVDIKDSDIDIEQYLYIKHICIHPDYFHKGYASSIYKYFQKKISFNTLLACVSEVPCLNQVSIDFHKKMGFKERKKINKNNKTYSLWEFNK